MAAKSFTVQIYNPDKARRLHEELVPIANLTAGNPTALTESMWNMLIEKVNSGISEWQAMNQVTDEFARRFLSTVQNRYDRAPSSMKNTTLRGQEQSEKKF